MLILAFWLLPLIAVASCLPVAVWQPDSDRHGAAQRDSACADSTPQEYG